MTPLLAAILALAAGWALLIFLGVVLAVTFDQLFGRYDREHPPGGPT